PPLSLIVALAYFFFFYCPVVHRALHFSLHDALPICADPTRPAETIPTVRRAGAGSPLAAGLPGVTRGEVNSVLSEKSFQSRAAGDRKSTRLNSSHVKISYAVFCLKKKKTKRSQTHNN